MPLIDSRSTPDTAIADTAIADTAIDDTAREILVLLDLESGIDDVGVADDLLATGRLDSLALFELVLCLEDSFGIAVDQDDLTAENFATVVAISDLIRSAAS